MASRTKRRKISEIYNDMDEINKRRPTREELDELAEVLNEADDCNDGEISPYEKVAAHHATETYHHDDESSRLQ